MSAIVELSMRVRLNRRATAMPISGAYQLNLAIWRSEELAPAGVAPRSETIRWGAARSVTAGARDETDDRIAEARADAGDDAVELRGSRGG
jgi:hypothetical protein